ncbi:matrixin family metalloprotease [Tautonia sp. JC769]|uniref:matrixin family metalloprotease n=1 Tax=Tautonia sp. JC769 TaxID=3232135 RepID=UPI00345A6A12
MADVFRAARSTVTTATALLEGLSPEERDELELRLAARGYKPELARTKRKAGVTGSVLTAAYSYLSFNALPAVASGLELLKLLRRPCCAVPDRSWLDPDTGRVIHQAITHGHWRIGHVVTVSYRFTSLPDAGDALTPDQVRQIIQLGCDCWTSVCGIRFEVIPDFDRADIYLIDPRIDGQHGTLADMYLPGPGPVGPPVRCQGRFDRAESWAVHLPGQSIPPRAIDLLDVWIHELGHGIGMDHEPGHGQERLNPMYSHFPHMLSHGRHWVGPKDTATVQRVYGKPAAPPPTPEPPPAPGPGPDPDSPAIGSYRIQGVVSGTSVPVGRNMLAVRGTLTGAVERIDAGIG